ncbi:esterase [Pseudoflavitalea sp. G-6-1-2]|uniref:esterase family protein n=1 Tax=Pseudoflavitalea sp. G-6-1-2 TaxID=2728841 RepID=UPI00146BD493|nr:alpha/beta hydrolase-fold protein [Pseudoflavitalea sp. G-6-1-2]NML21793.1 esterase [Pseudoflavitalea sp. G-6-1-2]
MDRKLSAWHSPALNKSMPIATYGFYGYALLLIPTAAADYLEYERFQLIDSLAPHIDAGRVKVFSIDSINNESWMNQQMEPRDKAVRHQQWNQYVLEEVIPYIRQQTSEETPILTCGASFGALHSANLFFKRPDLINGCIAMSGVYSLTEYTRGYFDDDVYFNSPAHYLPNLNDHAILEQIRKSNHIHILSGSGAYEDPNAARQLAGILQSKGIGHELNIWGPEWSHDWPTWRAMLPNDLHAIHF